MNARSPPIWPLRVRDTIATRPRASGAWAPAILFSNRCGRHNEAALVAMAPDLRLANRRPGRVRRRNPRPLAAQWRRARWLASSAQMGCLRLPVPLGPPHHAQHRPPASALLDHDHGQETDACAERRLPGARPAMPLRHQERTGPMGIKKRGPGAEEKRAGPQPPPDVAPEAADLPTRTPMYKANRADRYLRQAKIKEIGEKTGAQILCYVSGRDAQIDRDDTIGFVDLLHNVRRGQNIDLFLHTRGGDLDAAEKLIELVQ